MTSTETRPGAENLVEAATETARGMRAVTVGKAAEHVTHSDVRSFAGIANLLEMLVGEIGRQRALAQKRGDALRRIAELKVRSGAELIEQGKWQKIASELREIAGETLASADA